jgi:hypothetical protein
MASMARGLDAAERQAALIEAQWHRDHKSHNKSIVAAVLGSKADSRIGTCDYDAHGGDDACDCL